MNKTKWLLKYETKSVVGCIIPFTEVPLRKPRVAQLCAHLKRWTESCDREREIVVVLSKYRCKLFKFVVDACNSLRIAKLLGFSYNCFVIK